VGLGREALAPAGLLVFRTGLPTLLLCPPTLSAVVAPGGPSSPDPTEKEGRIMLKSDPPATPAELTESSLQLAQENAALHVALDALLEKSTDFARRQAEALAGFTEERAAEVSTHMGSQAAVSALQRSAEAGEDSMNHPWPLMASISVH